MSAVRDLARPEIAGLEMAFPTRRSETSWLDANESWEDGEGRARGLNRYPDPPMNLCARLAPRYGVRPEQLLLTRGSDDGIDALARVFCRAGEDAVQIAPPTFHMYALSARLQGAAVVATPRRQPDFGFDVGRVLEDWRPTVKLVYVCTPNNPTGGEAPEGDVGLLCRALAGKALVVVDEAYGEFSAAPSAAHLLDDHPHLVVLRTLSKAWALAGARVGLLLANPDVIELARRLLPPYPLATASLEAVAASLEPPALTAMQARIARVAEERSRLTSALAALPGVRRVYPSAANFLLVRFAQARVLHCSLLEAGIRVRGFEDPDLEDCLRITIGSRAENDRLLALLTEREWTRA